MKKKYIAITLGIMCFLLCFGIMIQLNTIKEATMTVGQGVRGDNLRDEVLRWKEKYDRTYDTLQDKQKELEKERQVSISSDESSVKKQERLKELSAYLGLTDVTGEGVIITVKDNNSSIIWTSRDLVHDYDLRSIVNEAKNTNAEAISINGQRITPGTAINCVGALIQVNNESIGNPFVIKIIGDKNTIYNNMQRRGSFLEKLKDDGIDVSVIKSDEITIEKYNGVLTDKYLRNIE